MNKKSGIFAKKCFAIYENHNNEEFILFIVAGLEVLMGLDGL